MMVVADYGSRGRGEVEREVVKGVDRMGFI